ncbi:MAG: hypothetical protein MR671_04765 [Clostridiales bacterium]|nr:hypothetical protein [Clostridiales bacterium]
MTRQDARFELQMIRLRANRAGEKERVEALDTAMKALRQPELVTCIRCRYCDAVRFIGNDVRLYCRWRDEYGGNTDIALDLKQPSDFCSNGEAPEQGGTE